MRSGGIYRAFSRISGRKLQYNQLILFIFIAIFACWDRNAKYIDYLSQLLYNCPVSKRSSGSLKRFDMKKLTLTVVVLMAIARVGFGSTGESPIKSLDANSKKTMKQMLLMNGRIEQNCDSHDPDSCLSGAVNQSSLSAKTEEKEEAPKASDSNSQKSSDERNQIVHALATECKAGKSAACKHLAVISAQMNKPRTAMQLFKMACENGDGAVCRELGMKLEKAGKKDLAALYLEKACRKGDQKSCAKPAGEIAGASAKTAEAKPQQAPSKN